MSLAVVVCSQLPSSNQRNGNFGNQRFASHLNGTIITYYNEIINGGFSIAMSDCKEDIYRIYIYIYIKSPKIFTDFSLKRSEDRISIYRRSLEVIFCLRKTDGLVVGYASWITIWLWHSQFAMERSTMLLRTVKHLFRLGPSIYTMAM